MKIHLENMPGAMFQLKVIHPFCNYASPLALKVKKEEPYELDYSYNNQKIPNPKFMRAKEALLLLKSVINDVKAGDELLFEITGPPTAKLYCDCVNIELECCTKIKT